jgi:hypothetical protein
MEKIKTIEPSLLFIATLYSDPAVSEDSEKILKKTLGDLLFKSHPFQWDYSSYYKEELGQPLFRQFIFLKDIIDPGNLADIKLHTHEIEETLSVNGKRRINLDPGYLTLSKIVLASTKNYAHRVYLGKGVYGEVTLIYKNGTYNPHLFTYRDYQDKISVDIFLNMRDTLKKMLT